MALRPRGLAPLAVQDEIYSLFGGERGRGSSLAIDLARPRARGRACRPTRRGQLRSARRRRHRSSGYDAPRFRPFARDPARSPQGPRGARPPRARADPRRRAPERAGFDLGTRAPPRSRPSGTRPRASLHTSTRTARSAGSSRDIGRSTGRPDRRSLRSPARHRSERCARSGCAPRGGPGRRRHRVYAPRSGIEANARARSPARRALCARPRGHRAPDGARSRGGRGAGDPHRGRRAGHRRPPDAFVHLQWHVYDALVVPVLIGITLDESMFLAPRRARPPSPRGRPHPAIRSRLRGRSSLPRL